MSYQSLFRKVMLMTILAGMAPRAWAQSSQITTFFPASGARNVNPDTPLRLNFSGLATLGTSGKIQIVDAATNTAVETIDVSSRTAKKTIGGMTDFTYYPIIAADNQARVYDAANPTLTATYGGFVNGDTSASLSPSVTLSTPATASSGGSNVRSRNGAWMRTRSSVSPAIRRSSASTYTVMSGSSGMVL